MEVRITKLRVAMAALFVLAGVGLASLLSPLVGTALANVGQVVSPSDHSGSAFFGKVSSDGKSGPSGTAPGRRAWTARLWLARKRPRRHGGRASSSTTADPPSPGPTATLINLTSSVDLD